jgi:hypothetical protein
MSTLSNASVYVATFDRDVFGLLILEFLLPCALLSIPAVHYLRASEWHLVWPRDHIQGQFSFIASAA